MYALYIMASKRKFSLLLAFNILIIFYTININSVGTTFIILYQNLTVFVTLIYLC